MTNLLDMSRMEAGVLELEREPSSVGDLLEEALAGLRPWIDLERVRGQLPSDLPLVDVDRVFVAQVLANPLENEARHAPEGSVIVVEATAPGRAVAVAVTEEGPGVPWEDRDRVFQTFHRRAGGGRARPRARDRQGVRRGARGDDQDGARVRGWCEARVLAPRLCRGPARRRDG